MISVADQTESLVARTKKLLAERGDLSLRQISEGAAVELEWLRKLTKLQKPAIDRVERVHDFLVGMQIARRFGQRTGNRARAGQ